MTDAPDPSTDKMASVRSSLTLGWQIAELYHSPKNLSSSDGRIDSVLTGQLRLPSRSDFPSLTKAQWLSKQIDAGVKNLLPKIDQYLENALGAVQSFWASNGKHTVDKLQVEVSKLHEQLLEAIYVFDSTLLKAYCLGQTLAEISMTRGADHVAAGNGEGLRGLQVSLRSSPSAEAQLWLSELKSLLPAHSAYAVSRTLDDWRRWAAEPNPKAADRETVTTMLSAQGHSWRQLLTDEKAAADFLKVGDYVAAGQQVFKRVVDAAKRLWGVIGVAVVLIGAVVAVTFLIKGLSPNTRLITNLLWLAGVLGISVKGAGSLVGAALKDVEGWLWQAELDESVAAAVAHLPPDFKHERLTGNDVGRLTPPPEALYIIENGAGASRAPLQIGASQTAAEGS
jgi:hypothetical protein